MARTRRSFAAVLTFAALALLGPPGLAALASPGSATFTGGAPLPPNPQVALARNEDGEPGMAVDGGGTIWVGSDVAPYAKDDPRSGSTLLSGEDVWKSTDGGRTFSWVADPFDVGGGHSGSLAGEDSDIAAAPAKNASGFYNVYAVSLWVGSTSLAVSQDGGATWVDDVLSGLPAEDRPWVAARGACQVLVAYHQLPTFSPVVNTYDLCNPQNSGVAETLNPVSSTEIATSGTAPGLTNAFGKISVDGSNVYLPMMNCYLTQPTDYVANAESTSGCPGQTEVSIAVSTDGGQTFNDYQVALSNTHEIPVWPDTVATDTAGTVYLAWSDNHNAYLDVSRDHGRTWTSPQRINAAPSLAAVYPTVAGGAPGHVDIAWYGTDRAGDSNDSAVMGKVNASGGAPWAVYLAESSDGGQTFAQSVATGTIHIGYLCTQGSNCPADGSRNLLDDFGVVINPATQFASIAYTSDQPQGQAATSFTGYTTELTGPVPGAGIPESPLTAGFGVAGLAVVGGVLLVRRRRPRAEAGV